ncbi:hypothetical protein VTN02DRAFT_6764 [Thermoascus thermophilus]
MPSTESSSNWDFTAVIDLLHSPTYPAKTSATPYRQSDSPTVSSPRQGSDVACDTRPQSSCRADASDYPRLGDFSSLWEFLGKKTTSSHVRTVAEEHGTDNAADACHSSASSSRTSKASEASSDPVHDVVPPAKNASGTTAKPIVIMKRANPCAVRNNTTVSHGTSDCDAVYGTSSDSSAGLDSDGDLSVFEPPISEPLGPASPTPVAKSDPLFTPPSSCDESEDVLPPAAVKTQGSLGQIRVQPIKYKSSAARKAGLVSKLFKQFPEFAGVGFGNEQSSEPIHVFVDSSNIMIGFHDCVKVARNIPITTRIRRLPLSFHNFSMILERGRPAAKRVLVGSDRFPAINEAERIGYETNILDRVHKVKHWTPRQLKFRNVYDKGAHHGGYSSETGSAPEERWVEQGVDEILHLKILESLVDTEGPATIVLATGDAAEAEYSGGFLKMVERALRRGWTVELVSFSQNTSYAYKRKDFRAKWGSRFKMIQLDDYIEELLDM